MPSETVVELKTRRPVHEQPQHSYTIPSSLYLDEKIYEQEKQNIFYCNWHYAGHASQLSKTGDYLTASVADESVFIVRCQDETLRGFYNVCRHRAHQLLEGSGTPTTSSAPTTPGLMHLPGSCVMPVIPRKSPASINPNSVCNRYRSILCVILFFSILTLKRTRSITRRLGWNKTVSYTHLTLPTKA